MKNDVVIKLLALAGLITFLFFAPVLGVLIGAFSGWVVGLFFSQTILSFLAVLGITGFKMWQIGAALGFIGSFFRSTAVKSD